MKRLIDIIASISLIILLIPVLFICSILVGFFLGRPVIFKQVRAGQFGKPFYIYKFRTMTVERNEKGELLPKEKRFTCLGQTLRKYSIDELPQLFNVLKGDLSLVGPRPLLIDYLPLYTIEQARRHEVKPGITGLAQVSGRNSISWEEKFKLDIWYVDHKSIILDLKILYLTCQRVIKSDGINYSSSCSMPRFLGEKNDERF